MKKKIILIGALFASALVAKVNAQVQDISFNAGANYEYTWFDKAMDIQNGMLGGVKVGFAFGPHVELHATYDQSFGAKSKLYTSDKFQYFNPFKQVSERRSGDVDMRRYGAEVKFNLLRRTMVSPFLAVGVGLSDFKIYNDVKTIEEQALFASGMAGLKFNATRRLVFTLAGKYMGMYEQEGSALINATADKKFKDGMTLLHNFGATAGVEYYFGGYNEIRDNQTANEYYNFFTNGSRGIRFVLDPGMMYADFTSTLKPLSDSWFVGGAAGIDFNKLLGIRGFYYQASKGGKDFDKLFDKNVGGFDKNIFMYGGYFTGRLNLLNGVTPYLNLGAGQLNVAKKTFEKADGTTETMKNAWFGMAGLGIEVPLTRVLSLYGTVNATIHDDPNATTAIKSGSTDLKKTFSEQVSYLTQLGIRFSFGASSKAPRMVSNDVVASTNERVNTERITEKTTYLTAPQQKPMTVYANPQQPYIIQVPQQPVQQPQYLQPLPVQQLQPVVANNDEVRLTVGELEELTQRMIERNRRTNTTTTTTNTTVQTNNYSELTPLERELIHILMGNGSTILSAPQQNVRKSDLKENKEESEIMKRLDAMDKRMDEQYNTLKKEVSTITENQDKVTIITKEAPKANVVAENPEEVIEEVVVEEVELSNAEKEALIAEAETVAQSEAIAELDQEVAYTCCSAARRNSFGIEAGIGLAKPMTFNAGVRANFRLMNTNFDIMPELYVGFSKPMLLAGSLNVVYNFMPNSRRINPYVGAGVWAGYADKKFSMSPNLLVGADLKLKKGAIFAEFANNNKFKGNNIMVGYRLFF